MQLECVQPNKKELSVFGVRKISVKTVKELGYKLTDRQIPLGEKPYKYGVLELLNEDPKATKIEVGFCLLYSVQEKLGIILPNPYSYYLASPSACLDFLR